MKSRRVVVTGMGALTPIGNSINEFWQNLVDGKSGADKITLFDADKFKTKFACEVKGFQAEDYLDRKEARRLDRFCQFALVVADQALTDSKLLSSNFNKDRTALVNLEEFEDGISPGQACVFYNKDKFGLKVLGGGWIKS